MTTLFRKLAFAIAASTALLALPAHAQKARMVEGGTGDTIFEFSSQDEQMNAAIAEAQRTLPHFLETLADPPEGVGAFRFKFPLGGDEHIWVNDVRLENGFLHGTLANHPWQDGWRLGDAVEVPLSAVSDWAYVDPRGFTHGAFTIRVMLNYAPPGQAAQIREFYGW